MSQEKIPSEGKCIFCGEMFSSTRISRHLQEHLNKNVKLSLKEKSYLVKVEEDPRWRKSSPYFLYLWVDKTLFMGGIDALLRGIWLECCGHMSRFSYPQGNKRNKMLEQALIERIITKGLDNWDEGWSEEAIDEDISMDAEAGNILHKGLKLRYEYDFGSSTYLVLNVIKEYPIEVKERLVLLSRNEPLELLCHCCKTEPATQICTVHGWNEESIFCDTCAKKHAKKCPDFKEYAALPVVNSPRMGVCSYNGGLLDQERDGVFVKK
ncbi:MAG: hypothetical protein LBL13_00985 [Bacteroidales bacterium]|jgi:hypothetical protein|nr:hypothetical protein [Bacteroidales bacterium]